MAVNAVGKEFFEAMYASMYMEWQKLLIHCRSLTYALRGVV